LNNIFYTKIINFSPFMWWRCFNWKEIVFRQYMSRTIN